MADRRYTHGPVNEAERLARRLEIQLRIRVEGLVQGELASFTKSSGSDLSEARRYEPGDDVRRIDWPATARTGTVQVRDTIADRDLTSLVVFPCSASLSFGTGDITKWEVGLTVLGALGGALGSSANRLGVVLAGEHGVEVLPFASPHTQTHLLIRRAITLGPKAGKHALDATLCVARRLMRRRGLVVIISDFQATPGWEQALGRIGRRHDLLVVEIADRLEARLATGALPSTTEAVEHAQRRRDAVVDACRGAGATHLRIDTESDWGIQLAAHLRRRARR